MAIRRPKPRPVQRRANSAAHTSPASCTAGWDRNMANASTSTKNVRSTSGCRRAKPERTGSHLTKNTLISLPQNRSEVNSFRGSACRGGIECSGKGGIFLARVIYKSAARPSGDTPAAVPRGAAASPRPPRRGQGRRRALGARRGATDALLARGREIDRTAPGGRQTACCPRASRSPSACARWRWRVSASRP